MGERYQRMTFDSCDCSVNSVNYRLRAQIGGTPGWESPEPHRNSEHIVVSLMMLILTRWCFDARTRKVVCLPLTSYMRPIPFVLAGLAVTATIAAGAKTPHSQEKFGRKTTDAPINCARWLDQDLFLAIDHGVGLAGKSGKPALLVNGVNPPVRETASKHAAAGWRQMRPAPNGGQRRS